MRTTAPAALGLLEPEKSSAEMLRPKTIRRSKEESRHVSVGPATITKILGSPISHGPHMKGGGSHFLLHRWIGFHPLLAGWRPTDAPSSLDGQLIRREAGAASVLVLRLGHWQS